MDDVRDKVGVPGLTYIGNHGFEIEGPDLTAPLVIDPGLEWATFLGGTGDDWILTMALDSAGNIVVAGKTSPGDFPVSEGAYDTSADELFDDG